MASFWLEYTQDGQRREFSFDAPTVTVGRDKTADFVLDHPTVSRQHAMIRADRGGCQLVVLSQGGLTAIDGGQVRGEVPLYDGSEIHFGQLSFTFRSHTAAPKPAGAPVGLGGGVTQAPAAPVAPDVSGGWGSTNWDDVSKSPEPVQKAAPAPAAPASDGIVTWDQIAASAEAQDDMGARATDFQRIQAAQAKADAQTKGNNPLIIYGGVIGILALLVASFWPSSKPPIDTTVNVDSQEAPFIAWDEKTDIDCVGQANCRSAALAAYKLGKSLSEQAGADITNPYNSYKQFDKAQKLLAKAGIPEPPPEMSDVVARQTKVKVDLDAKFNQSRVNFLNHQKRKMHRQMADELTKVQAYFPDKRALYNQWAVEKERKMKDDGIYPAPVLY